MFCLFVVDCCNDSDTPHSSAHRYNNIETLGNGIAVFLVMPTIYNFVWGIGYFDGCDVY